MTSRFSLRCAHDIEPTSALNRVLQALWDAVGSESAGALAVDMQPDGAAGGPDEMVDKLIDNRIQIHPVSGMILSRVVPVIAVEGLAFAYDSSRRGCEAMAGRTGDIVRAALRGKGIHAFRQVLPQGLNQIITRGRKLATASDLQGLRIRIGNSPYLKDLYTSLGCDPQPVDLQQVTAALRDGRAEAVEMPCYGILPAQRHEYLDHVGEIGIRFACFWLCVNLDAWNALGPELQSMLERKFETVARSYAQDLDRRNEQAHMALEARGYSFSRMDRASLERRLHESGFYERWKARLGEEAWESVQEARNQPI